MKVYLYMESDWSRTKILGVYSEEGMLAEKAKLLKESKLKQFEEIVKRRLEIESLIKERREFCLKDQNTLVPIQHSLKESGDKSALKLFRKERKNVLRVIDDLTNKIHRKEWENEHLSKYSDDALIGKYFPYISFKEYEVI